MAFLIGGANSLADTGYNIDNSLRFNDDDSPSLAIDLSSPNTDKFTISFWAKLTGAQCQLAALGKRLTGEAGDDASINIQQGSTARMDISAYNGVADANVAAYNSSAGAGALLRDYSAWYHLVYAFDTGQGTAGNRFKWYINGVLQSGYNTTTTPAEDADLFPSSGSMFRIGKSLSVETRFADCYLADYYYVDGQQYDHTYFGEYNDNGVWIPVEIGAGAGGDITFGTNGFHLEFQQTGTSQNSSGMGADTSGNDNHLAVTNLAATDITVDTPTNNFATWNPLYKASNVTLSEVNCKAAIAGAGQSRSVVSTIAVSKGKWYWETKYTTDVVSCFFGLVSADIGWNINATEYPSSGVSDNIGFNDGGNKYVNGTLSSYHSGGAGTVSDGDIVGCAANLDDNEVVFYVNGTALNSGTAISKTFSGDYFFVVQHQSGSGTSNFEVNFGNPTFSISSGNTDGLYGNFEYAPPSGYYALCTKRLAEYG